MRAVVQRVTRASVTVDGQVVGAIDRPGLVALVGVTPGDGPAQVELIARKIAELRVLRDEQSVSDVGAPVLVVSQFTLYADTRKGRRPTWNAAAPGAIAAPLVDAVADALRARGLEVATGPVRDRLAERHRDLVRSIARVFAGGITEGQFRTDADPYQFATDLYGVMLVYYHAHRLLADPRAEERARVAVAALLDAARPGAARPAAPRPVAVRHDAPAGDDR
jgi:D-tyrosyl-tRNA(Tyr) deacylase